MSSRMTKHQKHVCPYCGSSNKAEYLYGEPVFDEELMKAVNDGEIILAGCIVTDHDPDFHCNDCDKDFDENTDNISGARG